MKKMTTTRTKDKACRVLKDMMTISKVCLAVTCGLPGLLHDKEDTKECMKIERENSKKQ